MNSIKIKTIKSKGYSVKVCIFQNHNDMYYWVNKRRTKDKQGNDYNGIFLGEEIYKCCCKGKHNKKNCDFRDSKHLGCICLPKEHCTVGIISHEVFHSIMELKHRYKIKSSPGSYGNEELAWIMGDFVRQIVLFYYNKIDERDNKTENG